MSWSYYVKPECPPRLPPPTVPGPHPPTTPERARFIYITASSQHFHVMADTTRNHRHSGWPWCNNTQDHSSSASSLTISTTAPSHHDEDHNQRERGDDCKFMSDYSQAEVVAGSSTFISGGYLRTRNLSVVGLIIAWGASITALATGTIVIASPNVRVPQYLMGKMLMIGPMPFGWTGDDIYLGGHRVYKVTEAAQVALPLLMQMAIALVAACLGSIHSTTLRWTLWHEGRNPHNSSLRLFTSSKRNGPNKWPANVVASIGLVLAYGGASVMTFPISVIGVIDESREDSPYVFGVDGIEDRSGIDINGWGLVGLGAGLFLQAIISTWALIDSAHVGTWNANPLATARACRALHDASRGPPLSRGLAPDSTNSQSDVTVTALPLSASTHLLTPSEPCFKQPSARSLFPMVRNLANCIWTVAVVLSIMVVVIGIRASQDDSNVSTLGGSTSIRFVEALTGQTGAWWVWQYFGMVETVYNYDPYNTRGEWAGLLIQCAALIIPTFGLHAAELLVQLQRDESIWRRASTVGIEPDSGLMLEGARTWTTWVMFAFKSVVPWLFGFALACNRNIFFITLPALTLAVLFLLLGLFAEYLVRIRPMGSQPATYGDIQALVALVDDWNHKKIFWGDKRQYSKNVRLAGTAGHRLADLQAGAKYVGLAREPAPRAC
jgi:hypothetical protein